MNTKKKVQNLIQQPVESITFLLSTGVLFFACYLLSPFYETTYESVITSLAAEQQEKTIGATMLLASLPGLSFPFLGDGARLKLLKMANFMLFLLFLFLAVLRLLSTGPTPMHWLPILMLSLVCGIHRLHLDTRRQ